MTRRTTVDDFDRAIIEWDRRVPGPFAFDVAKIEGLRPGDGLVVHVRSTRLIPHEAQAMFKETFIEQLGLRTQNIYCTVVCTADDTDISIAAVKGDDQS